MPPPCVRSMWGDDVCPERPPAVTPFVYALLWPSEIPYEWTGDYLDVFGAGALSAWQASRTPIDVFHPISWQVEQLTLCGTARARAAIAAGSSCIAGSVDARGIELAGKLALEEGKKAGKVVAQAIAIAAPVIGVIPGIGQGVAMALTAASALALGKPLDEALIDIAANAVPGGALVKAAVTMAAVAASSLASGGDVGDVALAGLREGARSAGGEMAGAAFDAGVAIARGRALQEAGFAFVHRWFRGSDLTDKAATFALKLAEAAAHGVAVEEVLIGEAKDALLHVAPEVARAGFDEAVRVLVQNPEKFDRSIEELAAELRIPIAVAQAAFMAVMQDDAGRVKPNDAVRRALFTYVDPSAQIEGEARGASQLRAWTSAREDVSALAFTAARSNYAPSVFEIRGQAAADAGLEDSAPTPAPAAPHTGVVRSVALLGVCTLAAGALVWFFARE
jgi:hypothetical protein